MWLPRDGDRQRQTDRDRQTERDRKRKKKAVGGNLSDDVQGKLSIQNDKIEDGDKRVSMTSLIFHQKSQIKIIGRPKDGVRE